MANATVIKLTNNGGTTLLPISDSAYIQHKQGNWTTSTHDIISYTYGLAHPDHNDIQTISYSNGNGITLSGQSGKVDIKGSDYIQINGATANTLTISTNARPGTVTGVTITQGDGITVSNSGTAISTSGTRTITHATPTNATSGEKLAGTGKYFSGLTTDKFGHLTAYSTADLPTFTDTNTTVLTNGTTDVTADHKSSQKITLTGGTNKFTVKQGSSQFDVSITPSISYNVTGSGLTADKIVLGNGNSTVKTSSKGITKTPPNSSSDDTTVPTSKAVYTAYTAGDAATLSSAKDYADGLVTSAIKFVNTVTTIPTAASHGEAYLIGNTTSLSVNGTALEPGDMIIAYNGSNETGGLKWATSNTNWTVSSNDATLTVGSDLQTIATVGGKEIKAKVGAITNNVTGSGTSGKLTKWNGANTITDGPSIQTETWSSSSTNIPDCNAVGAYIASKNHLTGSGTSGQLAIWNSANTTLSGRNIQTATWTSDSTNIPTCTAVGAYIAGKGFLTSQSKDFGKVTLTNTITGYGAPATAAQAQTITADSVKDTLAITASNTWIRLNSTTTAAEGTSDNDGMTIGHVLSPAGEKASGLYKITTDAAGHVTATGNPSTGSVSTTVGMKYVALKTDADDLNATWLGTIGTGATTTQLLSSATGTFVKV